MHMQTCTFCWTLDSFILNSVKAKPLFGLKKSVLESILFIPLDKGGKLKKIFSSFSIEKYLAGYDELIEMVQ